jgi:hypothetical protein
MPEQATYIWTAQTVKKMNKKVKFLVPKIAALEQRLRVLEAASARTAFVVNNNGNDITNYYGKNEQVSLSVRRLPALLRARAQAVHERGHCGAVPSAAPQGWLFCVILSLQVPLCPGKCGPHVCCEQGLRRRPRPPYGHLRLQAVRLRARGRVLKFGTHKDGCSACPRARRMRGRVVDLRKDGCSVSPCAWDIRWRVVDLREDGCSVSPRAQRIRKRLVGIRHWGRKARVCKVWLPALVRERNDSKDLRAWGVRAGRLRNCVRHLCMPPLHAGGCLYISKPFPNHVANTF